ncbi:MAG: hypothetical protein F6K50_52905 [Moorea sp. SIO3I7]|uniref:hypothetical protein n=1 Tax=Moorena sp. SIO3I8 TaxID=2607833 RepID=UPI0013C25475|nr:hypothetical protein [Moorena sp. SIO3I8]NEO03686.1 hypothetical protein [Moorena sp. SIO3I7]NEO04954.1 hypothetical protein [Moorena sp. SIO3I8]
MRYGAGYSNTGARKNEGKPAPNAPYILISRFPIPDYQFPIPDSRFPIPDSRFSILNSQFSILNSR